MFLYTFSGSIIEEDEALEELEADKRPGENSIFINNFKMSVNDTVELFKGKCPVKNDLYNAYWPNGPGPHGGFCLFTKAFSLCIPF